MLDLYLSSDGDFRRLEHHVFTPPDHFWPLQYRNNVSPRMVSRYTRIFDAAGSSSRCHAEFHDVAF